jgi:hypothetical protein
MRPTTFERCCGTPYDKRPGFALVSIAFFLAALSWSPLLPGLFSISFSLALFATFFAYAGLTVASSGLNLRVTLACLALLALSLVLLAVGQSPLQLARTGPLPLLIFAAYQTTAIARLSTTLCDWLSKFLAVGVLGAMIGLIYAFAGGTPILSILNVDGRENLLYLTTMSNFEFAGVIRPSFIYDEAGAFSFLLCATVALREVLGKSRRMSYFLMLGGLVTLSITHILITVVFLFFRIGFLRTLMSVVAIAVLLAPAALERDELEFITSRFAIEDGQLAGDNRSSQIQNFLQVVNPRMILLGDVACHTRVNQVCDEHGDITSSPVTPTYKGGIVALLVQLTVHLTLVVAFIKSPRLRFSALAMSLLLLQRPYFEISGYGFITYLLLFLMFGEKWPPSRRRGTHARPSLQSLTPALQQSPT